MRPVDAVEAFLHHLAVERGSATNTLRSYTVDLERYVAHLHAVGVDDLAAVREEHVTAFVVALRTPATVWYPPMWPARSRRPRSRGGCHGR